MKLEWLAESGKNVSEAAARESACGVQGTLVPCLVVS